MTQSPILLRLICNRYYTQTPDGRGCRLRGGPVDKRRRGMFKLGGGVVKTVQAAVLLTGLLALPACAPRAPETYETHSQRAVQHSQAGRRGAAIAEYRAALALRPDSAEAHNNLGAALYDIGEREAAIN